MNLLGVEEDDMELVSTKGLFSRSLILWRGELSAAVLVGTAQPPPIPATAAAAAAARMAAASESGAASAPAAANRRVRLLSDGHKPKRNHEGQLTSCSREFRLYFFTSLFTSHTWPLNALCLSLAPVLRHTLQF